MKQITLLLIFLFSISFAQAKTKNILFVGNSYIYVNDLPKTIYDIALSNGDTITYSTQAIGGSTAQTLWNNTTVTNAIAQGGWDYVVIQCQSQEPSFPPSQVMSDTYPYVQKLDSLVQATNTCAETMFFMTWGRKNGDAANAASYPVIGTYEGMQGRLRESYLMFAQDFTASVSPVGIAWKNVRTQFPTIELYQADESHPSIYGTYLAACVFYSSIFHKSALGTTFITSGISTTDATSLQTVASNTVLDSLENWQQYGNLPFAKFSSTANGNNVVFVSGSKRFSNQLWEFGDGQTSNLLNPVHTYTSIGNYTVCLTAISACGKEDKYCNNLTLNASTAVNDINLESNYFNQLENEIYFNSIVENGHYEIYSLNGEKVQFGIINKNTKLDLNNYHGIYFLKIKKKELLKTFKLNLK